MPLPTQAALKEQIKSMMLANGGPPSDGLNGYADGMATIFLSLFAAQTITVPAGQAVVGTSATGGPVTAATSAPIVATVT
jgi:hypothetical protein